MRHLLEPYVAILDLLEPHEMRMYLWSTKNFSSYPAYVGLLLKWKAALLYVAPGLKSLLNAMERIHVKIWRTTCATLDASGMRNNKYFWGIDYTRHYKEFCSWKHLDIVDQSAADHVQSYLEDRLTTFESIIREELTSSAERSQKKMKKTGAISTQHRFSLEELLEHLPPEVRSCPKVKIDTRGKCIAQILPCPLSGPNEQEFARVGDESRCFCSWTLDWLPIAYLECFGYDAQSFLQKLHDPGHLFHESGRYL